MSLLMEGETRKRKITTISEDEDEDEDIKIEKFFALIRSVKDIRDQILNEEGTSDKRQTTKISVAKATTITQYNNSTNIKSEKDKMYATKKAVATAEKKTSAEISVSQRYPRKPPPLLKENAPVTDDTVVSVAAVAALGGSGGGCSGSGCARICRSGTEETSNNTRGADNTNNKNSYKQGRIFLDLNLSL